MSLLAAAAAGGALGARHALEPDHLAAVATLVEDGTDRPGVVGASWGIGHTVPIAALGLAFLALGVRLPSSLTHLVEGVVGVVLVYLGVRTLTGAFERVEHAHGTHPLHRHLDLGGLSVGSGHLHGDSLAVGALHGVAGSGALVVAVVAAAPDVPTAGGFLLAFGCCSVLTMAVVSSAWGRALAAGVGERLLRAVAGLVGVGVGALLLVEVAPL
jgi:high-affinity nickel permease